MTTPFVLVVRPTEADPTIPVVLTISSGGDVAAPFIAVERVTNPAFTTDLTALISLAVTMTPTQADMLRQLGHEMLGMTGRKTFHSLHTDPVFGLEPDSFVGEVYDVGLRRAIVSHLEWIRLPGQRRTTHHVPLEREHFGGVAYCYTLPGDGVVGYGRATYVLAKFTHDPVKHPWTTR